MADFLDGRLGFCGDEGLVGTIASEDDIPNVEYDCWYPEQLQLFCRRETDDP
jgi:hypothetical protein